MVAPKPAVCAELGIWRHQRTPSIDVLQLQQGQYLCPNLNVGTQRTYIFHQDRALVATPVPMAQCWDQAPWVDIQERLRLLVRIHFDVLIRYIFVFQRYPHPLDEGTGGGRCESVLVLKSLFDNSYTSPRFFRLLKEQLHVPETASE